MNRSSRMLIAAVNSAVCAACAVFLACVAAGGLALVSGSASLPGIFTASSGQLNGMPYLDFRPRSGGIVTVIVTVTLLGSLLAWRRQDRPPGRSADTVRRADRTR